MNKLKPLALLTILYIFCSCSVNTDSESTSDVLLRVKIGDKFGFINETGDIVIEPQFDNAYHYFTDGVCFAELEGKKCLINNEGLIIRELSDSINWIYEFINHKAIVRFDNGNRNIIDIEGKYLLEKDYKDIKYCEDGNSLYYVLHDDDNKWLAADRVGSIIGEPCDSLVYFAQNLCPVKYNERWGYMDSSGNIKIAPIYQYAKVFSEDGIARVRKDNIDCYIDESGATLFSVDEAITGFNCNRAAVKIEDKLYLIDKAGNKICHLDADYIYGFSEKDSLATIIRKGKAIKIDTEGREVLSTKYENIGSFINGVALVLKDNKYGLINREGKEIIPLDYEGVFYSKGNMNNDDCIIGVHNNDGSSYYDNNGILIGKDMGTTKVVIPLNPRKEDFIKYFDAELSNLDPIEGIYYVTSKSYYEDRNNGRIGLNGSLSEFYAIIRDGSNDEFWAVLTDGSNKCWANKFVKIGGGSNYAIVKIDKDYNYSSEGNMTLDNANAFGFRLELGHNNYYNFFDTYDFVRDYPFASEIEKIRQAEWTGTGFAIADGYILTNYHVTSGAKGIRVRGINGDIDKSYKAVVVACDKDHDLSIIRIVDKEFESLGHIPYSIGKAMVDVGDDVFVLGYPLVSSMGTEIKLTEGTISSSSGYQGDRSMYQISAAVQPGNSGGPLFNEDGVVIGVVCGKHVDAENANYAVKISNLYSLLNSSKLDIELPSNKIRGSKLSKKVKSIKDYVYLIECNSK